MVNCAIQGCKSNSSRKEENVTFHRFPKESSIRKLWIKATGRSNWHTTKETRICSKHFESHCFRHTKQGTFLNHGAVPNLIKQDHLKRTVLKSKAVADNDSEELQQTLEATLSSMISDLKPQQFTSQETTALGSIDTVNTNVLKAEPGSTKGDVAKQKMPEEEKNTPTNATKMLRSVRLRNRKAYLAKRRCSVPQCNMRPSNEISLHPCPNNAAVRNEWAEALGVSYNYVKSMVACSLHFMKIDFMKSENTGRVLKHNAVPSRNLPNRKKVMASSKNRSVKKEVQSVVSDSVKEETMTDTIDKGNDAVPVEETQLCVNIRECRACLKRLDDKQSCCNIFQPWAPPWDGMDTTIAEDLAKLANVEITETDRHSKTLCLPCYQKLFDAARFAAEVRNCDKLLRMRFTSDIDMDKVWPKPIQVDKNINGSVYNNPMDVEIKQEVVSDDEYQPNVTDNVYVETELANLDIKIEPEEFVEPPPMNITINGTISLDPLNSENKDLTNGTEIYQNTEYLETRVKQEPVSEEEQENEQVPDLPLECLLCTKSFNSVTGLKAHVIAQHSYKSVKRKSDGSVSPEKKHCQKYQCAICRRNFLTSTDLMVHETCHNKHACYGCTEKFDSFELLTRHRKRCKASIVNSVQKLKTLEDVKRPLPEEKLEHLELGINQSNNIDKEVTDSDIKDKASEVQNEDSDIKDLESEIKHFSYKEEKNGDEHQEGSDKTEAQSVNIEETPEATDKLHLELHSLIKTESPVDDIHITNTLEETLENDC